MAGKNTGRAVEIFLLALLSLTALAAAGKTCFVVFEILLAMPEGSHLADYLMAIAVMLIGWGVVGLLFWLSTARWKAEQLIAEGRCIECGHQLTRLQDRCPECGAQRQPGGG